MSSTVFEIFSSLPHEIHISPGKGIIKKIYGKTLVPVYFLSAILPLYKKWAEMEFKKGTGTKRIFLSHANTHVKLSVAEEALS